MQEKGFITGQLEPLKEFTPPHMVQIPLEEYKRFIEAQIKPPMVEIPLDEYESLKQQIRSQEIYILDIEKQLSKIHTAEMYENGMKQDIDRILAEIKKVSDSVTSKIENITITPGMVRSMESEKRRV